MKELTVKQLFQIIKGKKVDQVDSDAPNKVRFIQIDDLRNNNNLKYCLNDEKYVFSTKNDVIIAWDGANAGTIGFNLEGAIGSTLAVLRRKNEDFNVAYVAKFLQSKSRFLRDNCTGATIPHISRKVLEDIKIPLPPIDVQDKIVNLLGKAQSLIEKRREQIVGMSKLNESIFLEMFGDPIKNTMGWEHKKLSEFGNWNSGGTPSRGKKEYFQGDIPWLSSGELNQLYTYNSQEHISQKAIAETTAKLIPVDSLLLGMYDTAGLKSTITKVECSCNQAIAYSKLNEEIVSTEYVYYTVQLMKEYLKTQQRGVRQKNFNLTMIKNIKIIYPPFHLQQQFKIKFLKIEKQKELLEKSLIEFENIFHLIMHRAFNGELFK